MTSAVPCALRFAGVPLPRSRRAEHTMGMPQATHYWTPDDVRALPDDGRRYNGTRVPGSCMVDWGARLVERWRPADERPEVLTASLSWAPSAAGTESLTIDLPEFFTKVLGEA